jgi:ABC-type nickel/cobalt efflux system permease component RcnA
MSPPARLLFCLVSTVAAIVLAPTVAVAYIGPGAGLSAIGSLLALVAAVLVALIGFVWYPIKRLLRLLRGRRRSDGARDAPDA